MAATKGPSPHFTLNDASTVGAIASIIGAIVAVIVLPTNVAAAVVVGASIVSGLVVFGKHYVKAGSKWDTVLNDVQAIIDALQGVHSRLSGVADRLESDATPSGTQKK